MPTTTRTRRSGTKGAGRRVLAGLVLGFTVAAVFAWVLAAGAPRAAVPTSPGLQTAIIPCTWVDWSCTHGSITWHGLQMCHDQNVNSPACDSYPSCSGTITNTVDSGHSFVSVTATGYASISGRTLTVSCPNIGQHWQGYVTLSTT